jgi:hypothetical protein
LPAAARLSARERRTKARLEARDGPRRDRSGAALERVLAQLADVLPAGAQVELASDVGSLRAALVRARLAQRLRHRQVARRRRFTRRDPLFGVHHAIDMARDGVSRLVPDSWGASQRRERLEAHLWIWIAWRNYVRGATNADPRPPAVAAGVCPAPLSIQSLLRARVPPAGLLAAMADGGAQPPSSARSKASRSAVSAGAPGGVSSSRASR